MAELETSNLRQSNRRAARGQAETATHSGFAEQRDQAAMAGHQYGLARGQQMDALDLQRQRAMGQAPSLAQQQMAQSQQQGIVDQMALTSQARGGSLAAQQRQAQAGAVAGQMANRQQMGQLQAQEQLAAEQAYAAQANQLGQQAMAQQQFAQGALNNTTGMMYGGENQMNMANRQASIQQMNNQRQFGLGVAQQGAQAVEGIAQMGAMMSDENVKDISDREAGDEAVNAVKSLASLSYEYKGKKRYGQEGKILGISAQELEKAAPQLVVDTKLGKAVSMPGATSLALAAVSELARRMDAGA